MLTDDVLNKMADEFLKSCIEVPNNPYVVNKMMMMQFILGTLRKISYTPDGDHDYSIVVDAVNRYFKNHPDSNIDKLFEDALKTSFDVTWVFDQQSIILAFRTFARQLDLESMHKASFKVDAKSIQEAIQNNFDKYVIKNDESFDSLCNYVEQRHGISVR